MAGDMTLAMRTAQSALLTNQSVLSTISNNIANVNTPEYSRKIPQLKSRALQGRGAGVEIGEVLRNVDEGLMKSLRLEISKLSAYDSKTPTLQRLDDLFGKPGDNSSISHLMGEFANAMETLATTPERMMEQSNVVRMGLRMTTMLQDMRSSIQDLRLQADRELSDQATRIDELSGKILSVNNSLIAYQTVGRDTSELKDQRDQALNELSQLIDIRYFHRSDGDVVVFSADGHTMVDRSALDVSHNPAATVGEDLTHAGGDFDGFYIGSRSSQSNDITTSITGGKVKGLIDLRDSILPNLQSQIDSFAAKLRDVVNQAHNRGAPFPGLQSMTGNRIFTEPGNQTIKLDPTGSVDDVTIGLFDADGNPSVVSTLNTIMTSVTTSLGAQTSRGPWTINTVATKLQDWLQANGAASATVGINSENRLAINLSTTSLNLVFRDQTESANGKTHQDAEIGFDADGNGTVDEKVYGFSNFFGLNDFFVDNLSDSIIDSDLITGSFSSGAATLRFRKATGLISDVTISSGSSLQGIATAINNAIPELTASVVPDGSGYRLRIIHDDGKNFTLTQTSGTLLTTLGMHYSDSRTAGVMNIRADILQTPSLIARGSMQWDTNRGVAGEYFMTSGDDSNVQAISSAMTENISFKATGGMETTNTTLNDFAGRILAYNASLSAQHQSSAEFSRSLTESLQEKSDSIRGVNLDEEMSNLILYQQAYSASARIFTVLQRMMDNLEQIVG